MCYFYQVIIVFFQSRIYGNQCLLTNRWLTVTVIVLGVSLVDWVLSLSIGCTEVQIFLEM